MRRCDATDDRKNGTAPAPPTTVELPIPSCLGTPLDTTATAGAEAPTPSDIIQAFGDLGDVFRTNWTVLSKAITSIGLDVCKADGGYFLICDVSASGLTDMEFCTWLMKAHKIVGIPLSLFYAEPKRIDRYLVRFAVCKTRKEIERAALAMSKVDISSASKATAGV